jgi:hypothetical protein
MINSLGCIGGAWGVHQVGTAQSANACDHTGPVEGTGIDPVDGLYDSAIQWEIDHKYANCVKLIHTDIRTAKRRAAHRESPVREKFGPNAIRANTVCQQTDIAMRVKRPLRWNPVAERSENGQQANCLMARPMRSPWHLSWRQA